MRPEECVQPVAPHWPPWLPDWIFAPIAAGGLLLIVGAAGLGAHRPWLFASLAPSAYEFAERPELPGSRVYNALVGQFVGLGAGFLAVWLLNAWSAPTMSAHHLTPERVYACVLAMVLTSFGGIILKAFHPSGAATALLVAFGTFSTAADARAVAAGIAIVAVCGGVVRYVRLGFHVKPPAA